MTDTTSSLPEPRPIGYLAPEIPALSATFVYEEIHALERRGIKVVPFAVHRQGPVAAGQQELSASTVVLYSKHVISDTLTGIAHIARHPTGIWRAMRWLLADIVASQSARATGKLLFQFLASARLATDLKRCRCSHLHIHFAHVPTQIGMYASAFARLPFTVTAHANDIFERGFLLKSKADRATKILCISDFNLRFLISIGLPRDKLTVVRCGVSFPLVSPRHQAVRKCVRIGTLGRLVEKKGIDVLVHAIEILRVAPVEIVLSIAGDGPQRSELVSLISSLGLTNRVTFEGALTHNQVADWMTSLDIFVLACRMDSQGDMDGIPVVLMEAMSQSVPVVSTRISGIPELVIHEETGLLAEPGDSRDLANQIRRLIDGPDMCASLSKAALQHLASEFGQEVNIDRLVRQLSLD